jgi:hypothetical protein
MRPILALATVVGLSLGLSGCIAYDVASTTVGAATSVAGTAVDVTGDVVGGAAGAVSGPSHDKRAD